MKNNKKMYSIRIPINQIKYLKNVSSINYTTVSQYIIDLINKDMKEFSKNALDLKKNIGIHG